MNDTASAPATDLLYLTTEIVAAFVMHNSVNAADLPALIASTGAAIGGLAQPAAAAAVPVEPQKPAMPIGKSITPDYLISLEDGLKFKTLKRPLMSRYGLTPAQYRQKWRLPASYPMVAPNYSASRSSMAKAAGLGRKPEAVAAPAKPARKKLGLNFGRAPRAGESPDSGVA